MIRKVMILLHVLSLSVIISSLQSQKQSSSLNWYRKFYNDMSGSKLMDMKDPDVESKLNFLKQNQCSQSQKVPHHGDTFDFIVVGAGTAGAAIATRLSEIPHIKILLIETGSNEENLDIDIPILAITLPLNNNIAWKYKTKSSNKYCLGMKDNRCFWPTGKVVGGSSMINIMIATRGSTEDYDEWVKMGNKGWAYQDVLKYFRKLETIDIPELKSDTTYHGTDGPVHITYPFHTPLAETFLEASKELGNPLVDYNGKNEIGFSYVQATILNGTRMSSSRAYLKPARNRNNLHVIFKSTVTKVLIDPSTNRAVGVKFTKDGQNITVFTSKEVILCAGAIKSPQLLMLSGIGPAKHLKKLGINVIQDAPVGENLMDHINFFGLTWMIKNTSVSFKVSEVLNPTNPYIREFLVNRTGPLIIPGGGEVLGFVNTKHPEKLNGSPDIELIFIGSTIKEDFIFPKLLNLKDTIGQEWDKYADTYGWTIAVVLLKPKSRGRITLLANDIKVKPEIVPNYFDDPDDMRTMIAGIRTAIRLSQTKTMQKFNPQLLNLTYSECTNYEYDSDAYWECGLRMVGSTMFHYSGTCKMGTREDPTAVVDSTLKVIGSQGLRVADASIMPKIPRGHTSLPVYMIAEKAADMIKDEWGYLKKLQ